MKTRFLFPHSYKKIGWLLLVGGLITGIILMILDFDFDEFMVVKVFSLLGDDLFIDKSFRIIENGILDEILTVSIIIGGILVGFSKVKDEDEFIATLRTESITWSFYVNYAILVLVTIFIYGLSYFEFMIYNLFSILLFFIIRFHILLFKSRKELSHEE